MVLFARTQLLAALFCTTVIAAPAAAQSSEIATPAAPADLDATIAQAIATHPSIAAAAAAARAAGVDVRAAKWQRFPSLSVEGQWLDQSGNTLQAQAVVEQPLWAGGRIASTISRATAREKAAQAGYDEAVLTIALSTAQTFHEVHRWRERAAILARSRDQHNAMLSSMERRYAQEVSPLSDLELARSRTFQIEQQLFQARAQEGAAANRLRELVGDPFLQVPPVAEPPATWPVFTDEQSTNAALSYSPLLKRLRFEAEAVAADAQVARASVLPQLNGRYSYSENFGHRVGLVFRAQSDGGLARFAAADAAAQRATASDLQIRVGERQLRDQLVTLLREYQSATERLDGSMVASASAQRVMESYMRQFSSGRRTWLDVMNAVREATSAETDALDARIAAQSGLTRILLLTGAWAPATEDTAS